MHAIYTTVIQKMHTYTKMNLSTVKWAQWDKTQSRELLVLFICVCITLCTIVAHNIAQNRPDNFPSYLPDNHHCYPNHSRGLWSTTWLSGSELVSLDQRSYATPGPVSTGMGDRPRVTKPPEFVTSHSGQLSLLASAGRKMSAGQSAVTLCGWRVKVGMVHSTCG